MSSCILLIASRSAFEICWLTIATSARKLKSDECIWKLRRDFSFSIFDYKLIVGFCFLLDEDASSRRPIDEQR
jgi:hypothetical protein